MRILIFLILLLIPINSQAQISKPGIEAKNAGSILGRALTVNCDGNCIICNMSGTTMNITFSSSCGSSSPQFLLLQDGSFLLLQDNGKMVL